MDKRGSKKMKWMKMKMDEVDESGRRRVKMDVMDESGSKWTKVGENG